MQPHWIHCKTTHRKQTRWCLAYSISPTLFSPLDFNFFYKFLTCFPCDSFYKYVFYYIHNLGAAHITIPEHPAVCPKWCGLTLGLEAGPWHTACGTRHCGSRWWPMGNGPVDILTILSPPWSSPAWSPKSLEAPPPPPRLPPLPPATAEELEVTSRTSSDPEAWSHTPTQRTGSICHGPRVMRN